MLYFRKHKIRKLILRDDAVLLVLNMPWSLCVRDDLPPLGHDLDVDDAGLVPAQHRGRPQQDKIRQKVREKQNSNQII